MKIVLISVLLISILALYFARNSYGKPIAEEKEKDSNKPYPEVVDSVDLVGFDPEGEPEVRIMSDGSLYLVFNFMPPSYAEEDEDIAAKFDSFDRQIEAAIGVPVVWEDREFFLISNPELDTMEKIKSFIGSYRDSL